MIKPLMAISLRKKEARMNFLSCRTGNMSRFNIMLKLKPRKEKSYSAIELFTTE